MIFELMKCSLLDVFKRMAGTPFSVQRTLRYAIQFAQVRGARARFGVPHAERGFAHALLAPHRRA